LTTVTGPAGYGKTQVVASWARSGSVTYPLAWITLEEGDGRPTEFWNYVVEGLRRAGVALFPDAAQPVPIPAVDRTFLVSLAAELAGQPQPVVLVLDGVSDLTDRQWAIDLEFVQRHASDRLRLVLAGRWDPPLPLYRYRLAGRLSEIRGEDLAFTAAETAELLAVHGVALTPHAFESLQQHTEGWAAGLRLFAMALEGHQDAESLVATINGDEANIAEYFAGEVLRAQPVEVREFLLRTSILDTFTPDLAEMVTGCDDARRRLAELERENVFVQPVDDGHTTYRYHRLFAELLRARLAYEDPDGIPLLHGRAARWFAAEGRIGDAISHAVVARDWATAARLVVDDLALGRLVLARDADRLGEMFRALPDDVDSPDAAMVAAALALGQADADRCAKHLARAEELVAAPGAAPAGSLPLAGAVLDVLLASAYHDAPRVMQALATAESLLGRSPADRIRAHPELRALLLSARGTAQSWTGALEAAAASLADAVKAATVDGCEYVRLDCLQHLALLEAYRGRLRHAALLANQAVELADECGLAHRYPPVGAQVALAWVAAEQYDVEAAWRHIRAAEPMCGAESDGLPAAGFAVVKARLLRARGEFRGALELLHTTARDGRTPPAWLAREMILARARLLVAAGRVDEALATVRDLAAPFTADIAVALAVALLAAGDPDRARQLVTPVTEAHLVNSPVLVDSWLVLATVAVDVGDVGQARHALKQALRFAAPESQRRTFHEIGARLRQLLRDDENLARRRHATSGGTTGTPRGLPDTARSDAAEPVIVDALSKREMEVLQYVAAMVPTEEIAASMYVSVNTVKTHVRSILRKLSATRRNEAVRRARSLGLI
jgi:LuxR family maltose regulon positive regulatory protein